MFPGVRKFESEVISMALKLFHAGDDACGSMTSGGTESLLLAIKSYRDHARAHRGISAPELVTAQTVHPAVLKAAHYFGVRVRTVPLNDRMQMDAKRVRGALSRNTICVVVSAPQFAHGVIDPVEEVAAIASAAGVPVHVDACLGGFLLAFLQRAGRLQRRFDFAVRGVTSLSADLHKYGMAQKVRSAPASCFCCTYFSLFILLFLLLGCVRHSLLVAPAAARTYFVATDWRWVILLTHCGGLAAGGLIAAAWASMVHLGMSGYMNAAAEIQVSIRCPLVC